MTARPTMFDQALPLGTRLGGCSVEAVLAADECGFVYRMSDSLLLGRVAIKEYFPQALAERSGAEVRPRSPADEAAFAAGLAAFAEEARLLTRLQHPGLVRVLDSFEAHQTIYQVMPLIEGQTLEQARRQRDDEPPGVAWLRQLLLGLLDAVDALHAAGLVHGDIQPSKVMLRSDGRVLLMGFGAVCRALHAATDTAYAPLEQTPVGGHLPRGAWTDLYALGAVTWFAATGRPPPPAAERSAGLLFLPSVAMEAALEADPGDARDRAQLIGAVDRAMAVLPPDRPQGAAELRALFTAPAPAAAQAPPMAASPDDAQWRTLPQAPIAAELAPPRARPRRVAVGAWAAAVLLATAAGVLAWRWSEVLQASRSLAAATRSTPAPPELVAAAEPKPTPSPTPVPVQPAPLPADLDRAPAPAAGPASEPVTGMVSEPVAEAEPPPPAPAAEKRPRAASPRSVVRESARRPAKPAPPPRPAPRVVAAAPAPPAPVSPRSACGARENFSLYYCMQTQCRKPQFSAHAQCRQLRETGEVG